MVREIIHDPIILARASRPALPADKAVGEDLADTLSAHRNTCVGMAANMIGIHKQVIAFFDGDRLMTMYNPEIVAAKASYSTEEGCLSLLGGPRPCMRYRKIKVRYLNADWQVRLMTFEGFTAQIIQHEIDHCHGILI